MQEGRRERRGEGGGRGREEGEEGRGGGERGERGEGRGERGKGKEESFNVIVENLINYRFGFKALQ